MILLVDNYDSFTFNLVHYLGGLGADVTVRRNDKVSVNDALAAKPDAIVLSPAVVAVAMTNCSPVQKNPTGITRGVPSFPV